MRILITGIQADRCSALEFYLQHRLDLEEVAIATDYQVMLAQAQAAQPDIILLDPSMSNQPLVALIHGLQKLEYEPQVILINLEPEYQQTAHSLGVHSMVLNGDPVKKTLIAIETIRLQHTNDEFT